MPLKPSLRGLQSFGIWTKYFAHNSHIFITRKLGNAVYIPYKLHALKLRLFRKSDGEAHLHGAYTKLYGKALNT